MCTVAQQGISIQPNIPWIIDSGASDHMAGQSQLFHSYLPSLGLNKVRIANGSFSPIAGKGKIALTPTLTLSSVMHVPKLSCNLFSVSKFTQTNNCVAKFFPSYYEFQDLGSGKTIGNAREIKGLYYFDDGAIREEQVQVAKKVSSVLDEIRLWHWRLGHPNFPYLLFPSLFKNINMSQFNCEVYELAKHQRSVFRDHPYKKSAPFTLIHSDIWCPSRVPNLSNTCWFISFIDDHSRLCWIYLMKEKSETFSIFKQFSLMVQTQFNSKIKIVCADNGTKYFSNILGSYFKDNGIIHHSSCVNTP